MMGWWIVIIYCFIGTFCVNSRVLDIAFENESTDMGQVTLFVIGKVLTWPFWAFKS